MSHLPRFSLARSLLTSVKYNEPRDEDNDDEQRIHRESRKMSRYRVTIDSTSLGGSSLDRNDVPSASQRNVKFPGVAIIYRRWSVPAFGLREISVSRRDPFLPAIPRHFVFLPPRSPRRLRDSAFTPGRKTSCTRSRERNDNDCITSLLRLSHCADCAAVFFCRIELEGLAYEPNSSSRVQSLATR